MTIVRLNCKRRGITPEGAVLKQIRDFLSIKGIWHRRMNQGAARTSTGSYLNTGNAGMADLLCSVFLAEKSHPSFLWIEVKTEKGKQSETQQRFQEEVENAHHCYLIARSCDDVAKWMRERVSTENSPKPTHYESALGEIPF